MVIAAHLVNAVLGCAPHSARRVRNETYRGVRRAGYLALVVERAKKCLDFTATLYFLHLLFCCAFRGPSVAKRVLLCAFFAHLCCFASGWPRNFEWWVLNITGMLIMAVLGCG